jgi:FkbM family methyltransferase
MNLTSGHFNRVHVIEPQKKLLQKCERRFADYSNINYYQCVLSSECGTVKFSDDYGSGSRISENGVNYSAACIDTIVNDRVTFLKIDVEGSEMEVLNGSRNLINLHKPKIAVCVYHKQEHFLDIPGLILSIRSDYKVYFRHHSPGIFESVMYFI